MEAHAAYALRAWLASQNSIRDRTRRFAKWSAICSSAPGMAGQVAYHLLAQAGAARAPWPITTIVSRLPVLVLAMATTLAHMLRADADSSAHAPDNGTVRSATPLSPACSAEDHPGPVPDQAADRGPLTRVSPPAGTRAVPQADHCQRPVTVRQPTGARKAADMARILMGRRDGHSAARTDDLRSAALRDTASAGRS
jgi:hypothetical protein